MARRDGAVRPAPVEGMVEPALLLLLHERESYGYDLAQALRRRGLTPQPLPPARVYEALRRLEATEAVASDREASPAGPDRRRYRLMPGGRDRLDRWAAALRPTAHCLHALITAYNSGQPKEMITMGCNCSCRGSDERATQTAGDAAAGSATQTAAAVERPTREIEERITHLEAEVQKLRGQS